MGMLFNFHSLLRTDYCMMIALIFTHCCEFYSNMLRVRSRPCLRSRVLPHMRAMNLACRLKKGKQINLLVQKLTLGAESEYYAIDLGERGAGFWFYSWTQTVSAFLCDRFQLSLLYIYFFPCNTWALQNDILLCCLLFTAMQILDRIEDVQELIFTKEPDLLRAFLPVQTMHLTVIVAHLGTEEEVKK